MENLFVFVLSFIYSLSAIFIGTGHYREFKPKWNARAITWFELGGALFYTLVPGFNTFVILKALIDELIEILADKFDRPVFRQKTIHRPAA